MDLIQPRNGSPCLTRPNNRRTVRSTRLTKSMSDWDQPGGPDNLGSMLPQAQNARHALFPPTSTLTVSSAAISIIKLGPSDIESFQHVSLSAPYLVINAVILPEEFVARTATYDGCCLGVSYRPIHILFLTAAQNSMI